MSSLEFSIAFFPGVLYALGNIFAKKATSRTNGYYVAAVMTAAGIIPPLLFALMAPINLTLTTAFLGILGGLFLGAGMILYFKTLETQQITNTTALVLIQTVILTTFGVYGLSESLSLVDLTSGIVIIAGILLVSSTKGFRFNRQLLPAVAANVLWAFQWIVLSYAINLGGNSNDMVLVSRISGTLIIFAAIFLLAKKTESSQRSLRHNVSAVASGIVNGIGNVSYAFLVPLGLFALGSMLTALNPVITAVLAYFTCGEKLTRTQIFGLALATMGAVAITIFR